MKPALARKWILPHLLLLLTAAALAASSARAATIPSRAADASSRPLNGSVRIRVRLAEAIPKVDVRGYDLKIFQASLPLVRGPGRPGRSIAAAPDRGSEWVLRCEDGRIRAIPQGGGRPLDLREPVSIESPAGFLNLGGRPYRETLHVNSVGSLCEVVNEVDIEKYLDGLVNSEFSSKWNEESIAAQVVAARTYAYYQIRQARKDAKARFDVDATVRDQVYDGSIKEDARASRGVAQTRGLVLTLPGAKDFQPLKAFYHSTCGGMTELPEHVWGAPHAGFRHAVRCPFCVSSPRFHWETELTSVEVADAILRGAREGQAPSVWPKGWLEVVRQEKLLDLRPVGLDSGGRVAQVRTVWTDGNRVLELDLPGARFRDWVGPVRIRSTAFAVASHRLAAGKSWHFEGRGNGHGVGMCQWGAKVMGESGHKMAAILKFYYPDASLRRLW